MTVNFDTDLANFDLLPIDDDVKKDLRSHILKFSSRPHNFILFTHGLLLLLQDDIDHKIAKYYHPNGFIPSTFLGLSELTDFYKYNGGLENIISYLDDYYIKDTLGVIMYKDLIDCYPPVIYDTGVINREEICNVLYILYKCKPKLYAYEMVHFVKDCIDLSLKLYKYDVDIVDLYVLTLIDKDYSNFINKNITEFRYLAEVAHTDISTTIIKELSRFDEYLKQL